MGLEARIAHHLRGKSHLAFAQTKKIPHVLRGGMLESHAQISAPTAAYAPGLRQQFQISGGNNGIRLVEFCIGVVIIR